MGHALLVPFARATNWPGDLEMLQESGFRLLAMTPLGEALALPEAMTAARDQRVAVLVYRHGQHVIDVFVLPQGEAAATGKSMQMQGYTLDTITLGNQPADAVKELGLALQKGYPVKDAAAEPEFAPLQSRPDYQALMKKFASKQK